MTSTFDLTYYAMLGRSQRSEPHETALAAPAPVTDGAPPSRVDAQR